MRISRHAAAALCAALAGAVLVVLAAAAAASAQQSPAASDDFTFTLAGGHLAGRGYPRPHDPNGPVFWPICEGGLLDYTASVTWDQDHGFPATENASLKVEVLVVPLSDGSPNGTPANGSRLLWINPPGYANPAPGAGFESAVVDSSSNCTSSGDDFSCTRSWRVAVVAGEDADHINGVFKMRHFITANNYEGPPLEGTAWFRAVDRSFSFPAAWDICGTGAGHPPVPPGTVEPPVDVIVETWNTASARPTVAQWRRANGQGPTPGFAATWPLCEGSSNDTPGAGSVQFRVCADVKGTVDAVRGPITSLHSTSPYNPAAGGPHNPSAVGFDVAGSWFDDSAGGGTGSFTLDPESYGGCKWVRISAPKQTSESINGAVRYDLFFTPENGAKTLADVVLLRELDAGAQGSAVCGKYLYWTQP